MSGPKEPRPTEPLGPGGDLDPDREGLLSSAAREVGEARHPRPPRTEQAKRLPDGFRAEHEAVRWRDLVGLRDRISHRYGWDLNEDILWKAMAEVLPEVREALGL